VKEGHPKVRPAHLLEHLSFRYVGLVLDGLLG